MNDILGKAWDLKEKILGRLIDTQKQLEIIEENASKTRYLSNQEMRLGSNQKYGGKLENDPVYSNLKEILRDAECINDERERRSGIKYQKRSITEDLKMKKYNFESLRETISPLLEQFGNRTMKEFQYSALSDPKSDLMRKVNGNLAELSGFLGKEDPFLLRMFNKHGDLGPWAKKYME